MTGNRKRFIDDNSGVATMEFALVAPIMLAMLLGVLILGMYMQNYNSIRSIAFDVERYTVVEYQKSNKVLGPQIREKALAIGRQAPYNFLSDNFDATVEEESSGMAGAKKYVLTLTYIPPAISGIMKVGAPTLTQSQSIIVPD